MEQMTFHVVGLPHTETNLDYDSCAYTGKVRKFCNMMSSLGHKVFLYAGEENSADVTELITISTKEDKKKWFGDYDFHSEFFKITWNPNDEHWVTTNQRAVEEIRKRKKEKDFICVIGGACQAAIGDAFPHPMNQVVEFGIGYEGVFSRYRVFESYSHMHYVYGRQADDNGHFYDTVIPNYFETEYFPYEKNPDPYYLFLGRFIPRKGPEIAAEVTRRIGAKLLIAGQGVRKVEGNKIIGDGLVLEGDHIEYVGYADVNKRAELLSKAQATFMATTYLEPFGGVSIESLLCGTPVIATDFGAFAENIQHGVDGYRFRTIGEATWAAINIGRLNRWKIRDRARKNYSTNRVRWMYQAYFEQLLTLWEEGFMSDWEAGVDQYNRYGKLY